MRNNEGNWPAWRFFDGSISISLSMLLAVLLSDCASCDGLPLLGYLKMLTERDDGVIIVATLLLFPTTLTLYGGFIMFFAAKEFVERRAVERGRREGREEGRKEGKYEGRQEGRREDRERIQREMAEFGVPLTPELARILDDKSR